jgi:hypothetical protein
VGQIAADAELREKRFLKFAVIGAATRFELILRNLRQIELELATDDDRRGG